MSENECSDWSAAQLNLCQQLHYKMNSEDAHDKVDSLRSYMQQVLYSRKMERLSVSAASSLISECAEKYINLMDCNDTVSGLGNYAEEALSLARLKKTEINKWESSLKVESIRSSPFLKDFFTKQQDSCSKNESTRGAIEFLETLQENCKKGLDPLAEDHDPEFPQMNSQIEAHTTKHSHSFSKNCGLPEFVPCVTSDMMLLQNPEKSWSDQVVLPNSVDKTTKLPSVVPVSECRLTGTKRKQLDTISNENALVQNSLLTFRTAKQQLVLESSKSSGGKLIGNIASSSNGSSKKCLGTRRCGVYGKFVSPLVSREPENNERLTAEPESCIKDVDDRLKNIEKKMIELIQSEIMDHGLTVTWDDIAGLEFVKKTVKEIVVLPMLRPDIFTGLRGPPKGLLLFGPPGTGKTLIGKCIASNSRSTFFSISASSLTSKWIGEGEKMVRALFAVARCHQPAVIFIDEIDSLLTQRSDTEHESSRRMKTEFLIQLDGATTNQEDKLLVVGATNRPQELDEAARRRLVKRLYVPLPEVDARMQIIINLLKSQKHSLQDDQINAVAVKTEGYSGADVANLCKEAALGPIRCLSFEAIEHISAEMVRPISYQDFLDALHQVKASVSENDLQGYVEWNDMFGSTNRQIPAV